MSRGLGRLVIFIGNLFPLFIIVSIIYSSSGYSASVYVFTFLSFLSLFYWKYILKASKYPGARSVKLLEIKTANDSSSSIISYFLTYTVSIPSVSVIGGIKGLLVLVVLLFVIYLVLLKYISNRIMIKMIKM